MSLADKIKARPENAGRGPSRKQDQSKEDIQVSQKEVDELNMELDKESKSSEVESKGEVEQESKEELSPEQIQTRTRESLEDEIKKLREENAKRRKKEQAAKEKALAAAEDIFKSEREQYQSELAEMKKQLEELKDLKKEEAKVGDEVKKAETNAEIEALKAQMDELKRERDEAKAREEARIKQEEEEKALRKKAAENRFYAMLNEIPEEYKDYATLMFKGSEDPSEGLLKISKAKAQGLFGKKTIEVVNQVPKDKHNEDKPLTLREKKQKRVEALKSRRQGLNAGDRIL